MATSIQTLPSVSANAVTVNIPAILEKNFQRAQTAGDLLSVPSVIVTLGATSPAPITYNAAGLFTSLLQMADTTQSASGSTAAAVSTANTATADTTTNAATGDSGGTSVADLATLLGLGPAATNFDVLNDLVILHGLPATTAQAILALSAPNSNPSSATSAFSAPNILQGLPPNSTVQSINSLLSTNLGLAAAAPLSRAGTAATTTVTPTNTNSTTGTTANTGTASSATPSVATTPAAAIPTKSIAATPATSAPVSTANTATAGTATNAATGNSGGTSVADLAALLGLGPTATISDVLNALVNLPGLPATTAQTLATLLTPNANPSSTSGAGTLTVNQALANQLLIDLNSAMTGTTTTATSAFSAPNILQGLPPNSTVQSINNLLSTNLGLAAAALLNSTGTAATTTTAGNGGTLITTVAATATPTNANSTAALNDQLLANVDLTTASAVAVSADNTSNTGTTASTGTVSNAVPAVAAAPAATPPAETIAATPATAAPAAAPAAATTSIATPTAAAVTLEATSAVANNFLLDSVAQAFANIAGNPAYANIVAGLNMSVAIFRSQQASTAALPNPTYSVQPVTVVPPVNAIAPYAGSREAA